MSARKKGKAISGEAREIIYHVYEFMHEEFLEAREKPFPKEYFGRILERSAKATGVSRNTISRIVREKDRLEAEAARAAVDDPSTPVDVTLKTPVKPGRPKKAMPLDLDEYDIRYINYSIRKYCKINKKTPSLSELWNILKEELGYRGCKETLRRSLDILGLIKDKKIICKEDLEIEKTAIEEDEFAKLISPNETLTDEKDPLESGHVN